MLIFSAAEPEFITPASKLTSGKIVNAKRTHFFCGSNAVGADDLITDSSAPTRHPVQTSSAHHSRQELFLFFFIKL